MIRRKWYEMLFNSNKQYCMNKSWVNIIKWHLFQFLINLRWLKINLTTYLRIWVDKYQWIVFIMVNKRILVMYTNNHLLMFNNKSKRRNNLPKHDEHVCEIKYYLMNSNVVSGYIWLNRIIWTVLCLLPILSFYLNKYIWEWK